MNTPYPGSHCERCGELTEASALVDRHGAGIVCPGCDPGPTDAYCGLTLAASDGGAWLVEDGPCEETGHNAPNSAPDSGPSVSVLEGWDEEENEPVWRRICAPCLLARVSAHTLERLTRGAT